MEGSSDAKQVDKRKAPDTSDSSPNSLILKRPRIEIHKYNPSDSSENGTAAKRGDGVDVEGMPPLFDEKFKSSPFSSTAKDVDDNMNDNFFTEIKQREEKEMHRLNDNSNMDDDCPETEMDKPTTSRRRGRVATTRVSAESADEVSLNGPLTLTMKIYDESHRRVIAEHLTLETDAEKLQQFLQQHGKDLTLLCASGYSADISSQENSEKLGRISWNSLGSTIPRESIVSISSSGTAHLMKPPILAKSGRGRKRQTNDREPIVASTKISDVTEGADTSNNKMDISVNSLSNGDDHATNGESPKETVKGKQTPIQKTPSSSQSSDEKPKVARGRGRPPKYPKNDATPSSSKSQSATPRNTKPDSSMELSSDKSMDEKTPVRKGTGAPRGRPKSKPIESADSPPPTTTITTTPSSSCGGKLTVSRQSMAPGSSKSKNISFDVDILSDLELEILIKSPTLWGTIGVREPVFARWRDKNYYSGVVTDKGLNDTWQISFEDEMDDVASETHIVPVRIIGVDVRGVYSPDGVYAPHQAVVVGQKFSDWNDDVDVVKQAQSVMYAIQCQEFDRPIWCTRRQLSIGENDAKELRKEFSPSAIVAKAADINLDNVVKGPRVRAGVKVVGGAFDSSSADEVLLSNLTPRRFGTPSQKPIKEEVEENIPSTSRLVATPSTSRLSARVTSTSSPTTTQESASGTPDTADKPAPKRPGRPRKQMFDGLQFFLTASGGGDPSQDDAVIIPYDKGELKDSIERNGGKVIDAVSKEKGITNVFLISDSHARTVKYIYCLAGGIPCVSYEWIRKCIEVNQCLDWMPFRLKSGYSLEQESVIERHTQKPLKGMKIYVTAESDELYNYWKPVLTAAQAILLRPNKKMLAIPPEAEVLVTDATCATNLLNTANKNLIPIVKPEWLVQTIITGTKADFFGHERYRVPNGELENADEENDPPE